MEEDDFQHASSTLWPRSAFLPTATVFATSTASSSSSSRTDGRLDVCIVSKLKFGGRSKAQIVVERVFLLRALREMFDESMREKKKKREREGSDKSDEERGWRERGSRGWISGVREEGEKMEGFEIGFGRLEGLE